MFYDHKTRSTLNHSHFIVCQEDKRSTFDTESFSPHRLSGRQAFHVRHVVLNIGHKHIDTESLRHRARATSIETALKAKGKSR